MFAGKGLLLGGALAFVFAFSVAGCLVDPDDRCGAHQHFVDEEGGRCDCDKGYLLVGNTCEPTKKSALGKSCKSDSDCKDPAFSYCANADQDGYCTTPDCKTSAECDTTLDYGCNDRETPSFCERPPEGLGKSCSEDADCEGGVATFCEALSSHVCLINDCKADPDKCHADWVCCDIAVLANSICVPPSELVDGACPAGGMLIPRAK